MDKGHICYPTKNRFGGRLVGRMDVWACARVCACVCRVWSDSLSLSLSLSLCVYGCLCVLAHREESNDARLPFHGPNG